MASAAQSYRDSSAQQSGKNAGDARYYLLANADHSTLPPSRRAVLHALLKRERYGNRLWVSVARIKVETGYCLRTVQYALRDLERRRRALNQTAPANTLVVKVRVKQTGQILEVAEDVARAMQNEGAAAVIGKPEFRRSATYCANPEALTPRKEWQGYVAAKTVGSQHRSTRRAEHTAQAKESPRVGSEGPALVNPSPDPQQATTCRSRARGSPRKLTPREGPELVKEMTSLMRGCTMVVSQFSGLGQTLKPDDPGYRAPMSQENALIAACMTLGIPLESAREHLKLCCWKFEDDGQKPEGQ